MAIPVPNVIGSPFLLETLPPSGTQALSCTVIPNTSYLWRLIEKPPGSSAMLTGATSATPTLTNIDVRGTYIVFLQVTNSYGSSAAEPFPVQSAIAPYAFTTPVTTAFAVVRVKENSGLVKPGRGEYSWFESGLWPLFDKVAEGSSFLRYNDPTRTLTANAIVPDLTIAPNDSIVSVAGLNVRNDTSNDEHELYSPEHDKINVLSNLHVTGKDLTVSGGVLRADNVRDASGGTLSLEANASMTLVAGAGINLDAAGVAIQTTDAIDFTAETLVAIAAGAGDVQISASDDISLTAVDDITINATGANGDLNLFAHGTGGDIWVQAGTSLKLETTRVSSSITLKPIVATISDKPVRAPGLALCATTYDKSDAIFTPGPLFATVPTYTRYDLGSDFDIDITVAAFAAKDSAVVLNLKRDVGGTVSTLATLTTPSLTIDGWTLVNIKCRTKITKDGHTFTHVAYDFTPPVPSLNTPTAPGSTTRSYTLRDETFAGKAVSFQVETASTLAQYSAQMTCALYNPHDQDVL